MNQIVKPCRVCGGPTPHLVPSTSHVVHLLLSLITVGWWLIVWALVAANNATQSECSQCGRRNGALGGSGGVATGPTPQTHVRCPDCAELVKREARKCRHCGCGLVPQ